MLSKVNFVEGFYYVYVLYSFKDHKLYIGFTTSLRRRIEEHQQGKNISTSKRLPLKLIYTEAHLFEEDAKRRESYFKTNKGKSSLRQMLRTSLGVLHSLPNTLK